MAGAWALLFGVLALRASAIFHARLSNGGLDSGEEHSSAEEASLAGPPPPASRPPIRARPASVRLGRTTVKDVAERSPFEKVTLILVGSRTKQLQRLEEGYKRFFQEVVHMLFINEEDMESVEEHVAHLPVVLNSRSQDINVTLAPGSDLGIALNLESADTTRDEDLRDALKEDVRIEGSGAVDWAEGAATAATAKSKFPVDDEPDPLLAREREAAGKPLPYSWTVKNVAGPVPVKGAAVFGCLKKRRESYHSHCLPEVMKYIRAKHDDFRGVFVASSEFWFDPLALHSVTGLNLGQVWQLGGAGLRGKNSEKLGRKCWGSFDEVVADKTWQWYKPDKDANWNVGVRAYEKRKYQHLKGKKKPEVCMGWADAFYLPTETLDAVQEMLPIMKGAPPEIAVPTMLNYLVNYEKVEGRTEENCWGGCCSETAKDKALLSQHVCGSRMDLSDRGFAQGWEDFMFNSSMRLFNPASARARQKARYSSRPK